MAEFTSRMRDRRQLRPQLALFNRHDVAEVGTIILILDRAGLELGCLLGLDAVAEMARRISVGPLEDHRHSDCRDDGGVLGLSRKVLLLVRITLMGIGEHDDARLRAVYPRAPGALSRRAPVAHAV